MDHQLAERTGAADRYLLNEFSAEERAEFEAHYFDCVVCASNVREGSIFIDSVKALMERETEDAARDEPHVEPRRPAAWFAWLRPATLTPSLVALSLAMIVGYQNLLTLPSLRTPQLLSTSVIAPLTREAAPIVTIDPRLPRFNLNFMLDAPRANSSYVCQFMDERGAAILTMESGLREVSSFTLSFLLLTSQFPPGRYTLSVRDPANRSLVVQQYNFVIRVGAAK